MQNDEKIQMTVDPNIFNALVVFWISIFIFIMFLPTLFELKNPKDAGPRKIIFGQNSPLQLELLLSERESRGNQSLKRKVSEIISFLPNLET